MPQPRDIANAVQLVVEGRDAQVFFEALLRHMSLPQEVQVQNCGGINELHDFIKGLRGAVGFSQVKSLGIVRDAEGNPGGAFQSVCSALGNTGLSIPRRPESFAGNRPRCGILILPDSKTPGMLETICLGAVAGDPAMACVDQFVACLSEKQLSPPSNLSKARVHAFLVSRPKPDLLLGEAANAKYWPWDSPAFDHVKRFLRAL